MLPYHERFLRALPVSSEYQQRDMERRDMEVIGAKPQPCDLERYRRVVTNLARPSDEHVENFVQFVSEAHSWYKHLPLLPPGIRFTFFMDPFVGFDRLYSGPGRPTFVERTEESPRFHYTWMTTAEYRSRFGS